MGDVGLDEASFDELCDRLRDCLAQLIRLSERIESPAAARRRSRKLLLSGLLTGLGFILAPPTAGVSGVLAIAGGVMFAQAIGEDGEAYANDLGCRRDKARIEADVVAIEAALEKRFPGRPCPLRPIPGR